MEIVQYQTTKEVYTTIDGSRFPLQLFVDVERYPDSMDIVVKGTSETGDLVVDEVVNMVDVQSSDIEEAEAAALKEAKRIRKNMKERYREYLGISFRKGVHVIEGVE